MTRNAELAPLLKRLKLGAMLDTLPERMALARREQLDYASFLAIILADEISRREHRRIEVRLHSAGFEQTCRLEDFDWTAPITMDHRLLDAAFSLEFIAKHEHVLLVGPAGWARASWPRPWAIRPSGRDTPSVSPTLMISSRPWSRPGWTTRWTAPSGPSWLLTC